MNILYNERPLDMKNVDPCLEAVWLVAQSLLIADRYSGKYKTNIFQEHNYDVLYSQRGNIL